MNESIIAVVLGIVEGVTEFLPVSSTGHMILAGSMLGYSGEAAGVFEVFIQLGAILSIVFIYRDKFIVMLRPHRCGRPDGRLSVWHVAVGIVPVGLIGLALHHPIKQYLFSPATVIIGLIAGGLLMLAAEKVRSTPVAGTVERITMRQAFLVGLFQILALWPGFSRSGSTIAGGLLLGMNRKVAADFSFMIAVPLMAVACSYDLWKTFNTLQSDDLYMIAIGFVTAFAVAYLSVVWFLRFLHKSTLAVFSYYRFVLAGLSYYYFFLR